jgi:PAS domain S-box-containing protein
MNEQRHRILVVDDNPATRYSTTRVLKRGGFDVVEATTGGEAITLADSSIDLVLLDINMPDIDGFEVARILRSQGDTARIPIVHLSATFTKDEDKAHGLALGADGYLTHPVEPLVLTSTVSAFLRARIAERDIRDSEARFRAVFDRARSPITLVDAAGCYLDINPAFCRLLGRTRESMIGTPTAQLVAPRALAEHEEAERTLQATGEWRGVLPLLHRTGAEVEIDWSSSLHSLPGVQLSVGLDITARRRLEREREALLASEQAARTEAERANHLKDEFLATLSHELRNPLNAILGYAQILRRNRGDPVLLIGLETIERNARLQAQLISDLLDVSRIVSGKLRLDVELIDADVVVDAALKVVAPAAEAKGIVVRRLPTIGAPRVLGDSGRLQQIVWNLLSNAIKFAPPGGHVSIQVRHERSQVEIEVTDDGSGISAEFLPFIFDRFRQEEVGSRKNHGGLGLGLAIVKHLTEMHGGIVIARSDGEGRGATFVVTLPQTSVRNALAQPEPGAEHVPMSELAGLRVLVVEDDDDARMLFSRVFAEAGAEVRVAGDVATALVSIEQRAPAILISDIGMAQRDGYDLIRDVRARGHTAEALPAIALTAFARAEDRTQALAAGFQLHLTKPIAPQELLAAVASLVRTRADAGA